MRIGPKVPLIIWTTNMSDRGKILIIEDEKSQQEILNYNLKTDGYKILQAYDGDNGLLLVEEEKPDLIILDWMLPNISGIEICRQLKSQKDTKSIPIIMLSARAEETDKVKGLETGADDYLEKPYGIKELKARIKVQLKRSKPSSVGQKLNFAGIEVDTEKHQVTHFSKKIRLGPKEYQLLVALIEKPERVLTREFLLDHIWPDNLDIETRTVDVHMARLRKSLKLAGKSDSIRTVRGVGYSLQII
tara:strand:- start:222 stop:959 length:738 start_codon:yes stop_codon:yes gene_type:complete